MAYTAIFEASNGKEEIVLPETKGSGNGLTIILLLVFCSCT